MPEKEPSTDCKCKQCGYEWASKLIDERPKSCPRCKRYDWDVERAYVLGTEE